jgi:hypothetical protein
MSDSRSKAWEMYEDYISDCQKNKIVPIGFEKNWMSHHEWVKTNKPRKIVAFIGVIGSGKDHNTKLEHQNNPGSKILGFSDGVREFTWNILGWRPKDEYEYSYFKDNPVLNLSTREWLAVHILKGRKILENVSDQMRRYDAEFWGKYWLERAKVELVNTHMLIVPDCRHEEEAMKILNLASHLGLMYEFRFCDYKSERYEIREHSSEQLAQKFLNMGCQDGQIINEQVRKVLYR